ncbi:MAG: response regulator [Prolixibacteraceae bacterium]
MTSREEFIKKLRETFKIEASEGIAEMTSNLMELENDQSGERKAGLIESTFRTAHSLKGAARSVNFTEIETICQALEGVFSGLKHQTLQLHAKLFDLFHTTIDLLADLLALSGTELDDRLIERVNENIMYLNQAEEGELELGTSTIEIPTEIPIEIQQLKNEKSAPQAQVKALADVQKPEATERIEPSKTIPSKSDNTIRISIEKLDSLLTHSEEMLVMKQTFNHFGIGFKNVFNKIELMNHELSATLPLIHAIQNQKENSIVPDAADGCESILKSVVHFFEWSTSMVKNIEADLDRMRKLAIQEEYSSGLKIEALLDEVKKIISIPFSTILDGYPKAVRDLSKDQGKMVSIEIKGSELEIDRRILDELRIPLLHLMRNSIDHGIEFPTERVQKNKSETGKIQITVDRLENNRVKIVFSDDGAGVNIEKVSLKLLKHEKNSGREQTTVDEKMVLNSLFNSGFSTSEMITDISGRGLGLSIVKEKIEQLGGTIQIVNHEGKGIEFVIEIPLSLVTFRGVYLKAGEREFVLPTSKIERVLRIEKSAVKNIENKATIPYLDGFIPLVHLTDVLEMPGKENENQCVMVVVLGITNNPIGFAVDEILDEEMVLVKKFNTQLKRVRNIEGATVMGAGKVIPILNVADLLKSALKVNSHLVKQSSELKVKNSILVVEDSITSRMLLKTILESAGYKVFTAIDGIDGYTKLKEEPVDLVVSDVDMPRMNGLDMTAKIRSDKTLMNIPVVLVTSLSKREDRERGLEVGANGYIVKSNFDQSNLLEVIEKLIGN